MAGKRISGITIEVGGDTTKLSASLKNVDAALRTTQTSLRDVEKLLKLDPSNTELLQQKQKLLASAIDQTKERLAKLKEASEQAAKTAGNYDSWKAAYTPIKDEIDATSKKLRELKERQKEMQDAGKVDTDEYRALQQEIGETSDKLKTLKEQAKAVSDEFGHPISPEQYDSLQREIAETEHNLSELESEEKNAGESTKDLGEQSKQASEGLKVLGDTAAAVAKAATIAMAAATTAVVGFVTSSVDVGKQFDSAMSQVAATLGLSVSDIQNNVNGAGDTFDLIRDKALEMGASTNYTAKEAAEGLNILAMSGYDAESSVGMIEDVLHLAAAGGMDLASAAGYISGAMKGFADETKGAGYYADLMAKGATLANTSVAQLGDAMSSGAAGAAAYNQSADDMTLALLRLAEQGDVGAAAGTALSAVMKNLYTPTDQAKKALEELGVAAYENGEALDINDIVNNLSDALSKYSDEEANAYKQTIFGIQGLDAFNKMTVTGVEKQTAWAEALAGASATMDDFRSALESSGVDWNKYSENVWASGGAVDGVLEEMVWNLQEAGTSAEELQEYMASEYNMDMEDAILAITALTDAMANSGEAAKQYATMTDNLEGDLAALGSAFEGLQIAVYEQVEPAFRDYAQFGTESIQQVTAAFREGGLDGAMEALGPIIENGIAMLLEQVPAAVDAGAQLLGAVAEGLIENLPLLAEGAVQIVSGLTSALTQSAPGMLDKGAELLSFIAEGILSGLPKLTDSAVSLMQNFGASIEQNLPVLMEQGLTMVLGLTESIRANAGKLVDGALELATNLAKGLVDSIPIIIENVPAIITNIAGVINDNAPKILAAGVNIIITLGRGLVQAIPVLIANIPQIIQAMVSVWSAFNWMDLGKSAITFIKNGINGLKTAIPDALKSIGKSAENLFRNIDWRNLGTSVLNLIKTGILALRDIIPQTLRGIGESAIKTFTNIDWPGVGKAVVNGIIKGVAALKSMAVDTIKNVGQSMLSGIKGFLGIASPSKEFAWIGEMVAKGLAKGVEDKASEAEKAAETLAKNVYSTVKSEAERQIKYERLSLTEQLRMWMEIQRQFTEGSDQWWEARDKVFDLEDKVASEQAQNIKNTYNSLVKSVEYDVKRFGLSTSGQLAQYEKIRDMFVRDSEEWLAADEKVFDARQALLKEQAQAWQDYYKDVQTINQNIASLEEIYQKTLQSRGEEIYNSYKLFDEVPKFQEISGQNLLRNLRNQISSITFFYNRLEDLSARGVGDALVDEIRKMGVGATDELAALLDLTDSQLAEYDRLYQHKHDLSGWIATQELEGLREETDAQIREQLASVESLYTEYAPQIGEAFPEGLAAGILAKKDVAIDAAIEVAKAVEDAIREQTETHSPSKLFERIAGEGWIGGMVEGVRDGAGDLQDALSDTLDFSALTSGNGWADGLRTLIDNAVSATNNMAAGLIPSAYSQSVPRVNHHDANGFYPTNYSPENSGGRTYNLIFNGMIGGRTVARGQQSFTEEEAERQGQSLIRVR